MTGHRHRRFVPPGAGEDPARGDGHSITRREFVRGAGLATVGAALAGCGGRGFGLPPGTATAPPLADEARAALPAVPTLAPDSLRTDELGNPVTTLERFSTYGNYYEFTRARLKVADAVGAYEPPPLRIEVGGLVRYPRSFEAADLARFGPAEHIYRLRCIEAWAMVVPWIGFPLNRLLAAVEPLGGARFVRFESVYDPARMPGQRPGAYAATVAAADASGMGARVIDPYIWPYAEGLRLDEAMHDLVLVATGSHDRSLTAVNGAPARIVVPWTYAYKSIKSVMRIELVADRPICFWPAVRPDEYGFYGNVNPSVPHPRWAQVKEARYRGACPEPIVPTLVFNGYGDQVGHLYASMDLSRDF